MSPPPPFSPEVIFLSLSYRLNPSRLRMELREELPELEQLAPDELAPPCFLSFLLAAAGLLKLPAPPRPTW